MKNGPYELVIAPSDYPGKKYRGRYCYEHHLVWWQNTGTLPGPDELIHHKDEQKRRNVFDNLELMKKVGHAHHHGSKQTRSYVEMRCPACRCVFIKEKRHTHIWKKDGKYTTCSRRCKGRMSGMGRLVDNDDPRLIGNIIREFRE
jgi:hypothetical protein